MADTKTELVLQRVQSARLSRDFSLATKLLRQSLDTDPDNVALWTELGNCYVKAGNDAKAVEPYNQVLRIEPFNVEALTEMGGVYRRLGELDRSIAVLEKALMIAGNNLQIHYNLGHTYKLAGRYDAAEECFNQVLEQNPNDVLAINHIGNIAALQGNHNRALQAYWRALCIDPNHPILHLNMAKSYQSLGKTAEARTSYENALKSKPGWEDAMNGYAELLMHEKDLSKCDSILDQAIRVNPSSPELHSSKGHLNVKKGKFAAAEDSYTTALDFDSENMNALNGLELLYEKQGRTVEAMKKIQQMDRLSPGTLEYELRYSKLLIDQKMLEEAGEKLRAMYKNNLDNTAYLNMLSQYFVRSGRIDKANGCFKRISQLEPGNITYLRDTAWQYFLNGQYDQAMENLQYYLQKHPEDPSALALCGTVYEKMEQPDKALEQWRSALQYDENNPVILADVQRLGEKNTGNPEVTALITDIITDSANTGDADSIQRSLMLYENSVQNMKAEETQVAEPVVEELASEIESLESIDYDQLLQFEEDPDGSDVDSYDTLTLDIHPDDILRPIDEEVFSRNLQKERMDHVLSDDDMPFEYEPTRDGDITYDPFMEGSKQKYGPEEEDSTIDVTGSVFEDEEIEEDSFEPTEYRSVGEMPVASPMPAAAPVAKKNEEYSKSEESGESEEENIFDDILEDSLFPGDRDTSEDEIPTVEELIRDPLDDDEVYEMTEVPTISDLIGDDPRSAGVADTPVFSEEPQLDEIAADPVIEPVPEIDEVPEVTGIPEEPALEPDPEVTEECTEPDVETFISEHPDPEIRTMETVGNVLQNVFQSKERPVFASAAAMFSDLRDMTQWLPDEKLQSFMTSLDRLKLDYVIARLNGRPGLLSAASAVRETGGIIPEPPKEKPSLLKTMEYLRTLAGQVPDASQAEAMTVQMDTVVGLLKRAEK